MRCDILVGGTDKGYIRALVQFLLVSDLHQFNIKVIEASHELMGSIRHGNHQIYLLEEAFLLPHIDALTEEELQRLLVLTEPISQLDLQRFHPLLKYQSAYTIEGEVIRLLQTTRRGEPVLPLGHQSHIIAFYSPIGGAGTTTMAQISAQIMAGKGKKVLFLSFEGHPAYDPFYSSLQNHNLSDYMVYLQCNHNWLLGLEAMVSVDLDTGVHYLQAVTHPKDMAEFDLALLNKWLFYVRDMSDYDYIVVDIGQSLYDFGIDLLKASSHRIFLTGGDWVSHNKWHLFLKAVDHYDGSLVKTNKTLICNKRMAGEVVTQTYDCLFNYDPDLHKKSQGGQMRLNPYGVVYGQMEVVLNGL